MKYVLLDTNIILDILIDRKNNVSYSIVESLKKLLDFGEIKLVIPDIVIEETTRHVEDELNNVINNIDKAIKNIDKLYGVTAYQIEGLNIDEYKKNAKCRLQEAKEMYTKNKDTCHIEIISLMKLLFEHTNTITINDNDLLEKCLFRKIYKKAPLHIEGKESYADALIAETLINIEKYIKLEDDDSIIFVTGNYKDFSDKDDKDKLHGDIVIDLKKKNLYDKIIYVKNFSMLIGKTLATEVENAQLQEEFEADLRMKELEEEVEFEQCISDNEREQVGLSSLNDFEDMLVNGLEDSSLANGVYAAFNEINEALDKLEECNIDYEEIKDKLKALTFEEVKDILEQLKELLETREDGCLLEVSVCGLDALREWLTDKQYQTEFSVYDNNKLPDTIEYGDNITIFNVNHEEYTLQLEDLYLSPSDGDKDEIDIKLVNSNNQIVEKGIVVVDYGFVETDEDGGIGDACDESIDYYVDEVIEGLKNIAQEFIDFAEMHKDLCEKIKIIMNIRRGLINLINLCVSIQSFLPNFFLTLDLIF